jgi:site-specific recombinase XerD
MSNAFIYQSELENGFSAFLGSLGISEKTKTNYLSDVRHFLDWLISCVSSSATVMTFAALLSTVTIETLESYKNFQTLSGNPSSTINRRLSSVRTLFRWASESGQISTNPTETTKNLIQTTVKPEESNEAILGQFEAALKAEGAAETTVKNYLNDVEQFIFWINRTTKT